MRFLLTVPCLLVTTACSAMVFDRADCSADADCRGAFGFGSVCGEQGYCETLEMDPLCSGPELPIAPDTLLAGTIFDHSLDSHVARYRSAELAFTNANAFGGVDGRSFELLHCDNDGGGDSDLKEANTVAIAEWLSRSVGVPVIIGPSASSRTLAAFEVVEDTLIISPSATSDLLTDAEGFAPSDDAPGLLWRTAAPDSYQAAAIAQDMEDREIASVAIIYQEGAYGEGLKAEFEARFSGVSSPFAYDSGDTAAVLETTIDVGGTAAQEVLFISSEINDFVDFLNTAAVSEGYGTKTLFLTDTAKTEELLTDTVGASSTIWATVRLTAPSQGEGETYSSFASAYIAEWGESPVELSYTAHAYDAGWLALAGFAWAIHREGDLSGTSLAKGLRRVSDGVEVPFRPQSYETLIEDIATGTSVDVVGASGQLDYDPATEETSALLDVWAIDVDSSAFVRLYTWDEKEER